MTLTHRLYCQGRKVADGMCRAHPSYALRGAETLLVVCGNHLAAGMKQIGDETFPGALVAVMVTPLDVTETSEGDE